MEIRPYQSGDLESLTELMSDLGYPTTGSSMRDRMKIINANPLYYTFIALKDNLVVGMAGCRDIFYYEADGFVIQISALVVKKDYQGQGIGKALITFVEQWAQERGANSLYLTSGIKPEREKAHDFYKGMGFEITGYRFVKSFRS